jgi:hypothetical protein
MARMRPDIRSSGVEPHVREALLPLHKVATSASKVHMSSSIARVLRGRTTLTLHTFAAYGVCPFPTYGYYAYTFARILSHPPATVAVATSGQSH